MRDTYAKSDDARQLAALTAEVRQRQAVLEGKVAPAVLASRATALLEGAQEIISAFRTARGQAMPVTLFPDATKNINLGVMDPRRTQVRFRISTAADRNCKSSGYFEFWAWHERRGLRRIKEPFEHKRDSRDAIFTFPCGGVEVMRKWLAREYEALSRRNALERFEGLVASVADIMQRGTAATCVLTHNGVVSANEVSIRINGKPQRVEADPFWIRVE
ncbi:hypothetical protein [Kordiimonas sp.]|uniref:hypothetical protein n=1 Tax=Kordiimonas sp. TaxID=1970157 RepID=UPI003A8E6A14